MMEKKLLTICLPTYNRSYECARQLNFILNEVNGLEEYVDILIGDNSNNNDTEKVVNKFLYKKNIKYIKNRNNLGLVGNLYSLSIKSKSKYIWFIGDDDELEEGILLYVINVLKNNENLGFIFINHKCYEKEKKNIVVKKMYEGVNFGLCDNGKEAIFDLFEKCDTALMFITACVYETDKIMEVVKNYDKNNLTVPLAFSFSAALNRKVYVTDEVLILNKWGDNSWKNEALKILTIDTLNTINNLYKVGYKKEDVKKLLRTRQKSKVFQNCISSLAIKEPKIILTLFSKYKNYEIILLILKKAINKIFKR